MENEKFDYLNILPLVSPPFEANLYTHLFINMVQKELNFKNYNKDWRLSSAFDRHSPAKRDEVGELVHLVGDSVPRSATNNNI